MAAGSWSRDMGDGADDLTVFIMSTGEIIVYQGDLGTSPSLIGKYQTSDPIGRQCAFNVGGELIVITRAGLYPMSAIIESVPEDARAVPVWGKVAPGVAADAVLYGNNAGWSGGLFNGFVIVNVPQVVGSSSRQWVLNTRNARWTTFNHPMASGAALSGVSYIGGVSGGLVYKLDGANDNGSDIIAIGRGGFGYLGGTDITKRIVAVRPNVVAESLVQGIFAIDGDYVTKPFTGSTHDIVPVGTGTAWGSPWGSPWADAAVLNKRWLLTTGRGRALGIGMRVNTQAANVFWDATDVLVKVGGRR